NLTVAPAVPVPVLKVTAKYAGNWGNAIFLEVSYDTPNPEETFTLRVFHREGEAIIASEEFANLSMDPNAPRYAEAFINDSSQLIKVDDVAAGASAVTGYSESRRPIDSTTIGPFSAELNNLVHPSGAGAVVFSKFIISVNDGPPVTVDLRADPTWTAFPSAAATTSADIANEIKTRINTQLPPGVKVAVSWETVHDNFVVLRITSDTAGATKHSVRIRRAPSNDLAGPLMLGIDQGGVEAVRFSDFRPAPTATLLNGSINSLAALQQNAFNQITIAGTAVPLGTILRTTGATARWYVDAFASSITNNKDGVREKLRILAKKINDTPGLAARAEVWGYRLALVPILGTINAKVDVTTAPTNIGAGAASPLFTPNTRQYTLGTAGNSTFQTGPGAVGRDDDGSPLEVADYTGSEIDQTGFHALDSVDIFNLLVLPEDTQVNEAFYTQLVGPASIYCQQHRAFLLMNAPNSWTNSTTRRPLATSIEVNALRALVVKDYSAVFYPRVQYSENGVRKFIGPAGIIAGLCARIDTTRGVWKAPAGVEADLRGVLDLEVNLTDKENGVLNKLGANCLRKFPAGIVNWGARTMDGSDDIGSEWKYIPIRRLALFLEESLFRGTKWIVFEPNDEPLWAKIRLNINAFMMDLFRKGAFQGSTPDKAFYVKCDGETTTQNDRNLGIVNIEVGFAPLKPAEFVIIKIQQIAGDL
ncbi:MAG TPA: phage tail sheath C-terminal domain-containing protein, partial [Pyrinomonadaceae bacterium]|nr:phage tail sheath C-terminal domain-containing protein [Pyrinomonadaceae bacterium]